MTGTLETFLADQSKKLFHFGVKGQKWGFRRTDAQLAVAAAARADVPDAVRAKETLATIKTKGSLAAVSDADLNHLVNRLNLEKRYADIDPSKFQKGHGFVKTTLDVGTTMNSVIKFANSPAGHLLARQFNLTKSVGKHATPLEQLLKASGGKKKNK